MVMLGFLKVKLLWNKDHDVIIYVHGISNKILWHESNYVVDMVMWPKCGNSSIFMREVLKDLARKTTFFEGWSWFKFNNLGLSLGTNLKVYAKVAKWLKLKFRMFLGLIHTFVEVTVEKLTGGLSGSPPSWIGLSD